MYRFKPLILCYAALLAWMLAPSAHACACCLEGGHYSVDKGVSGYVWDEIAAHKKPLSTRLDTGVGESGFAMSSPRLVMTREPSEQGLTWHMLLTERDDATQHTHKVELRFTPAPAKTWQYVRRTEPALTQQPTTSPQSMAHDFLIPGKVTVLRDRAGLLKDSQHITAQLVLYGRSNHCFAGDSLLAFRLDMALRYRDGSSGQLSGEGRMP